MGGEGSGRRPDPVKQLINQRQSIGLYGGGELIVLPDYSGVAAHAKTKAANDARYVNATGDTVSGTFNFTDATIDMSDTGGALNFFRHSASSGSSLIYGTQYEFSSDPYRATITYEHNVITITPDAEDGSNIITLDSNTIPGNVFLNSFNLVLPEQNTKLILNAGSSSGACGTLTQLSAGTATVNNTTVTGNSIIILTRTATGGTLGTYTVTQVPNTSFTITSTSATDTSTFSWVIIEPYI